MPLVDHTPKTWELAAYQFSWDTSSNQLHQISAAMSSLNEQREKIVHDIKRKIDVEKNKKELNDIDIVLNQFRAQCRFIGEQRNWLVSKLYKE